MNKSSNPSHHLPFYGNDFFQALEGYPDSLIIGYLRALWHYWHHCHCEGLPDDDGYLQRICRCEAANWMRTKGVIFDNERFFKLEGGKWHQSRCRREHLRAIEIYNAKVAAMKKARAANPNNRTVNRPIASPNDSTFLVTINEQQPEPEPEPECTVGTSGGTSKQRESRRFAPPSLDSVRLNGAKIGLSMAECEKFHAYYESNGWKVGRNGMKSWEAAMLHWKGNVRNPMVLPKPVISPQVMRSMEQQVKSIGESL